MLLSIVYPVLMETVPIYHLARECSRGGINNIICFKSKENGHCAHEFKVQQPVKLVKNECVNTVGY